MSKKQNFSNKLAWLNEQFEDVAFMQQYGLYVKRAGKFIAPKIQDVIYQRINNNVELNKMLPVIISNVIKRAGELGYIRKRRSGVVFVLPYSTTFALVPGDYLACRATNDRIMFIDQVNFINDFSGDKSHGQESYFGSSALICGMLFADKTVDENAFQKSYEDSIDYINDFITSYRLIRHDHTIYKVTRKTLPSDIIGYTFDIKKKCPCNMLPRKAHTNHLHDTIDLSNKLILPYDEIKDGFMQYCEVLPFHKEIRYILDIMLDTLNSFCLGKYEDVILLSDRYMELSLQVLFNKVPGLENAEFPECIFSKKPDCAAVPIMAEKLELKGDAIISEWWANSRELRNKFVHNLANRNIKEKQAMQCMKYNFELISKIVDRLPLNSDDPAILLKLGYQKYEELFES